MFVLKLEIGGETHDVNYQTIDECFNDEALNNCLDDKLASCVLWIGSSRLTGRPITSSAGLQENLIYHSKTILKNQLDVA